MHGDGFCVELVAEVPSNGIVAILLECISFDDFGANHFAENQLVFGGYVLRAGSHCGLEIAGFVDVVLETAAPDVHFGGEQLVAVVIAIQLGTAEGVFADVDVDVAPSADAEETQIAFVVFEGEVEFEGVILVVGNGVCAQWDIEFAEHRQGAIAVGDEVACAAFFAEVAFCECVPAQQAQLRAKLSFLVVSVAKF